MELQLVYRILRKISDWTVTGYYSEVLVQGQENVLNIDNGTNGPVILCASHHNEMIDIATLARNMPRCEGERRHVSFWAKESMFSSVVGGWVMRCSGAIPVKRNPNKSETGEKDKLGKEDNGIGLFATTTHALSLNKVVGIFPEGTSYTQPGIVQVLPGAARAAVEYEVWRERQKSNFSEIVIVPVGIVYTDKSRYQSRLRVQYGTPIRINEELNDASAEDADSARIRSVSKAVAIRIEQALFELTINAPDWATLYAARIARDIVFEDSELPLDNWTSVSQRLVDLLASPSPSISSESIDEAKRALTRYFALMYHTNLNHSVLSKVFPLPVPAMVTKATPTAIWKSYHIQTFRAHLSRLCSSFTLANNILHTVLILPILPLYIPAFLLSHIAVRSLATPGEEEGEAQFRAVGGGIGVGIGLAVGKLVYGRVWRKAMLLEGNTLKRAGARFVSMLEGCNIIFGERVDTMGIWLSKILPHQLRHAAKLLGLEKVSMSVSNVLQSRMMKALASRLLTGLGWLILAWCVVKWYGFCIKRAHNTYTYTLASPARRLWIHHLRGLLSPSLRRSIQSSSQTPLEDPDLIPYLTLPPPPTNAFIRRRERKEVPPLDSISNTSVSSASPSNSKSKMKSLPMFKLVPALLCAREEARNTIFALDGLREATNG